MIRSLSLGLALGIMLKLRLREPANTFEQIQVVLVTTVLTYYDFYQKRGLQSDK